MKKKRISIIVACAVTLLGALPIFARVGDIVSISTSISTSTSTSVSETIKMQMGDVNGDGEIDSDDAVLILRDFAGLDADGMIYELADVNSDSDIDSDDAVAILRYFAGLED